MSSWRVRATSLLVSLLVAVAALVATPPATADNLAFSSYFCDGQGRSTTGEGTAAQGGMHADIFAPALAAACPKHAGLVNYLGTTDADGFKAMLRRARTFIGRETALSTAEKAQLETPLGKASLIHQVPLYVDGWAIAYNLPCSGPTLKLRSNVLAAMYAGVISQWNHRLLVLDNAWLATCNRTIQLTRRADPAGSTTLFQDYLAKRNHYWLPYRNKVAGEEWPDSGFACSGLGDGGMVDCVSRFTGSIGYIRTSVAVGNGLPVAQLENSTGSFVSPSSATCYSAASSAVPPPHVRPVALPSATGMSQTPYWPATLGDWSLVSLTDAPDGIGTKSYPLCSFGFAVIPQQFSGAYGSSVGLGPARAVVDYFTAALRDSTQDMLGQAGVAPLPPPIRATARDGVNSISIYNFSPLGF